MPKFMQRMICLSILIVIYIMTSISSVYAAEVEIGVDGTVRTITEVSISGWEQNGGELKAQGNAFNWTRGILTQFIGITGGRVEFSTSDFIPTVDPVDPQDPFGGRFVIIQLPMISTSNFQPNQTYTVTVTPHYSFVPKPINVFNSTRRQYVEKAELYVACLVNGSVLPDPG